MIFKASSFINTYSHITRAKRRLDPFLHKRIDKPVFFQAACMQGMFGGIYNGKELYYSGPGNRIYDDNKKCDACRKCLEEYDVSLLPSLRGEGSKQDQDREMDSNSAVIRLDKICKSFGGLKVLSDVDLEVNQREIVGLIGPNGAGKSTLFNIITNFYKPDRGEIYLLDKNITGLPPHKICRMGIARTFQLVKTFLKMTLLENAMTAAIYGQKYGHRNAFQKAVEALELVGLFEKKDMMTAHLTLSDRRLLEVAMSLASMPVITLLDEPMAGLNLFEIQNLLKVIHRARDERNISILWIEHKVDAVLDFCDRVAVLDYGLKIADGNPDEIVNDPKVIEAYLGEPHA